LQPDEACRYVPSRPLKALARELDERPGRARLAATGGAHEVDLALELEPLDARLDERSCG
jgi:hypothetical protein